MNDFWVFETPEPLTEVSFLDFIIPQTNNFSGLFLTGVNE